jgi:hypothetical protein
MWFNGNMNLQQLITQYFSDNKHLQLATLHNGQPWLCTVYFAADDDFNLYWMSLRSRQHSQDILQDARTAVAVVRDTDAARKQALQITGNAYQVADDNLQTAHAVYTNKFGPKDYDLQAMKRREANGSAYWVFKPTDIWLWDEVNFPENPKQHHKVA